MTTVFFDRENMTTSGLESSLLFQQGIATALRGQRGIANHLFEEGWLETQGAMRGSAFRGRVSPGRTKRMTHDFPLAVAETVACTAC